MLSLDGPLLLACNHPNSFLDAIILATLFRKPVYSLARGDAFAGKIITKILTAFNMLPVYRVSEGVENLEHNYATFNACQQIFRQKGIVLIFSEGRCINEWHLRPVKKGTARLALKAWEEGPDLRVLPVGINYSSFRNFGKNIILNFGEVITGDQLKLTGNNGKSIALFNAELFSGLKKLVLEISREDEEMREQIFRTKVAFPVKAVLAVPAVFGFLIHAPLLYLIHLFIKNKAANHYDSVVTGLLFFLYPIFLLLLFFILFFSFHSWYFLLVFIVLPFLLWSYLQLKKIT
jgi:hypothetical protein